MADHMRRNHLVLEGTKLRQHLEDRHRVPTEQVLQVTEFRRRLLHADLHRKDQPVSTGTSTPAASPSAVKTSPTTT